MSSSASSTLIKTKLFAPVLRAGAVSRAKLLPVLEQALQRKLTLVTAAAGFGKTTLMGQWYAVLKERQYALCWLSLDRQDNDPKTFMRYFIGALQQIDANLGREALQYLDNAPAPDFTKPLASLINELVQLGEETFFFLDDVHFIDADDIKDFLELFLNLSPPNFHLVMAGRTIPALPLAHMRVSNDLVQLTADKLRFDVQESAAFMRDANQLELSAEQLAKLNNHCEGWAAGLQLASLSLRDAASKDAMIERFAGDITDVADYLATAVFNQQPEAVREFLLHCAYLDRFNSELCDFVLQRDDSWATLRKLDSENLFVIPLDDENNWYRFHHLFQEFLQTRLRKIGKETHEILCSRACEWFQQHGYAREAVDYALRANDMNLAANLIEQRAVEEFMLGRMPRVTSWIGQIPEDVMHEHPNLLFLYGTALYHMNQSQQARRVCEQLREAVNDQALMARLSDDEQQVMNDNLALLKAGVNMAVDNVEDVIRLTPKNIELHQPFMQGVINNMKGYGYFVLGDFQKAKDHIATAYQQHRKIHSDFGIVYSGCFLAQIEFIQGNLRTAQEIVLQYQQELNRQHREEIYVSPVLNVLNGCIFYENNRIDEAIDILRPNLKIIEEVGHMSLLQMGYTALAKSYAARDNIPAALKLIDYLHEVIPFERSNRYHQVFVGYQRIKLLLRSGKHLDALQTASLLNIPDLDGTDNQPIAEWSRTAYQVQLIRARLLFAGGQLDAVIQLCDCLHRQALEVGIGYRAVEAMIILSLAHFKLGHTAQAVDVILPALIRAGSNNMLRVFIDEGSSLLPVLNAVRDTVSPMPASASYLVEALLQALQVNTKPNDGDHMAQAMSGLLDQLSQRELDVLRLMAEGRANQHIADTLHISENTVKWHSRNIFSKLGVKNRTAAVITAQELGLVNP